MSFCDAKVHNSCEKTLCLTLFLYLLFAISIFIHIFAHTNLIITDNYGKQENTETHHQLGMR